jgi:heat shock protein HslJ
MKRALIFITLIFVFLFTACSPSKNTSGGSLEGNWTLTAINGKAPLDGSTINLSLNKGQAGGKSGCNSYGGSYKASGQKLTFSQLMMTEMACMDPAGIMDQESTYLQLLGQVTRYQMNDNQLELLDGNQQTLLSFAKSE